MLGQRRDEPITAAYVRKLSTYSYGTGSCYFLAAIVLVTILKPMSPKGCNCSEGYNPVYYIAFWFLGVLWVCRGYRYRTIADHMDELGVSGFAEYESDYNYIAMTQNPTHGVSATMTFSVQVPLGMTAGQSMLVQAPNGQQMSVCIPEGLRAGQSFPLVYSPGIAQAYPQPYPTRTEAPAVTETTAQTAIPVAQAHPIATSAPAGSGGTETTAVIVAEAANADSVDAERASRSNEAGVI